MLVKMCTQYDSTDCAHRRRIKITCIFNCIIAIKKKTFQYYATAHTNLSFYKRDLRIAAGPRPNMTPGSEDSNLIQDEIKINLIKCELCPPRRVITAVRSACRNTHHRRYITSNYIELLLRRIIKNRGKKSKMLKSTLEIGKISRSSDEREAPTNWIARIIDRSDCRSNVDEI